MALRFHAWLIVLSALFANQLVEAADIVFSDVNIVDVENGQILEHRDVHVEDNRIKSITEHKRAPQPAEGSVSFAGKYLVPGLWDMHVHFRINKFQNSQNPPETLEENKDLLPLFLAFGITAVHDMGSDITPNVAEWQRQIDSGDLLGPSIFLAGPKIEGAELHYGGSISVTSQAEADRALQTLIEWNVDGVKLMGGTMDPELFNYVLEQAEHFGLRTYAHLLESSPAVEASRHSLDALAHMRGVVVESSPEYPAIRQEMWARGISTPAHRGFSEYVGRMYASVDLAILKDNVDTLASRGTWLISTYNRRKVRVQVELIPGQVFPDLKFVGPNIRAGLRKRYERAMQRGPDDLLQISREYEAKLLQMLPNSDVGLLVGTDAGTGNIVPGRSFHLEMASMVEDGLTPAYVLRAATINAARFMGKEDSEGSIAVGKKANLLVLDANPLDDIANTQRIVGVVRNGQWLSRADLDELLEQLRTKYLEVQ